VILVADARHGDPDQLAQAVHELDRAGATVLGVVLNQVNLKRSRAFDYYYYSPPKIGEHVRSS
jgi:Mrp family chromosome partitioning ATPase